MKILTQIVRVLKPSEVRLIRNFYKVQPNGEIKRRLELFELVKSGKVTTDMEAAKAVYKGEPNSAYSHLKNRLQKDVLNILLLKEGSKKYETKYAQAVFDCRRMLIEGQILIERGAYRAGEAVLLKANELAVEYELFAETLLINDLLRTTIGIRKGEQAYLSFEREITDSLHKLEKYLIVKDYYYRLGVLGYFAKNIDKSSKEYAKTALQEAEGHYNASQSPLIGYFYNYLGIYYGQLNHDYELAYKYALDYLKLVEVSPSITSETRIGTANLQIASIAAYKANYDEAMGFARSAKEKFITGLFNELQAIELMFVIAFHKRDYTEAETIMEMALVHPKYKANKIIPAKWEYFKANLLFVKGQYNQAAVMLMKETELTKDKAGWLMGYRIMELMCAIEQGELDIIDYRAESFKKLLQRQKDENVERPRTILKVLNTYVKTGGDIKMTLTEEKTSITKLREGKEHFRWDPLGFEMIRFDEWLDRLAAKQQVRVKR